VTDASARRVSPDELKAAILLFSSLLDEPQRRLFAVRNGSGGDTAAIVFWLNSSAWIPILSPAAVSNCSLRMS
jgi:hypothetical protein